MRIVRFASESSSNAVNSDDALVLVGISFSELSFGAPALAKDALETFSLSELMAVKHDYICLLPRRSVIDLMVSGPWLVSNFTKDSLSFSLLIPAKTPPNTVRRYDGEHHAFICTSHAWLHLMEFLAKDEPRRWCFLILHRLMAGADSDINVTAIQIPVRLRSTNGTGAERVSIITPHRGTPAHLRTALLYSKMMTWGAPIELMIGLDSDDLSTYVSLALAEQVKLYHCQPAPQGPYVIRQKLIEESTGEYILGQDSDDLPCADRLIVLMRALHDLNVDMVGSHEVEVNEMDFCVRVYRYPLDVSSVLSREGVQGVSSNALEPFLHATALMKKSAFLSAGGFSTDRPIAYDSQFLLRAHFSMRIANVNEFLYLRRVHREALTVAPETHNGNRLRQHLSSLWSTDFLAIKAGALLLENSSLVAQRAATKCNIMKINIESVLK